VPPPLLQLEQVDTYYGEIMILKEISLEVGEGELVCLLGGNASGKSTTLKTIIGVVQPRRGKVRFHGEDVTERKTSFRIARGMAIVPENRRLFAPMTVLENLELGAFSRDDREGIAADLERVLALFPRLRDRLQQKGGTLSGGEQQMLAMGRALMARPEMLLLDEPSMGLSPILVETIFGIIRDINRLGTTILLVEQNARMALRVAHRGYVIQTGRIVLQDAASALLHSDVVRKAYLGET
jgi:branched-chain amino acid transport system ATP-binding protein